ncbi:MAG: DUF4172 domain-containing protein [Tannerella sp.]|nr:DUF4172 domain-containing protein [Tannerella sp.]
MAEYIWQQQGWPYLTWNVKELSYISGEIRSRQGRLAGKISLLKDDLKEELFLNAVTLDILKSSELDGIMLDEKTVALSVAQQLKLGAVEAEQTDPVVDRIVRVTADVLLNHDRPLTEARLLDWKKALSVLDTEEATYRTEAGNICSSGYLQTRDFSQLSDEMNRYVKWFNTAHPVDPTLKAGVAHLRLYLIRPFDKDNGRIARALTDLLLARSDNSSQRLYSLSSQICRQQETYRRVTRKMQNGNPDITEWLTWFLYCLETELTETEQSLTRILERLKFREKYSLISLNERQVKMIHLLWEDADVRLTSSYWADVNACSPDTALRDIQDLIRKKILHKQSGGGRSTSYALT